MTQPDYPLPVLPSYELYQVAHIATFLADRLGRHRGAVTKAERAAAVGDLVAGRAALERALGATRPVMLPEPLDAQTFHTARGLLAAGPRWANVVSLAAAGQRGWAVVGYVPGVGPVGARTADRAIADALRQHLLTQPAEELGPWAITAQARPAPPLPDRADLTAVVRTLDPRRDRDRAVAQRLFGLDRMLDAAIQDRFVGTDLGAPFAVRPTPPMTRTPQPRPQPARPPSPSPRPRPAATPAQQRGGT